jgi:hypothetical protein
MGSPIWLADWLYYCMMFSFSLTHDSVSIVSVNNSWMNLSTFFYFFSPFALIPLSLFLKSFFLFSISSWTFIFAFVSNYSLPLVLVPLLVMLFVSDTCIFKSKVWIFSIFSNNGFNSVMLLIFYFNVIISNTSYV